MNFPGRFGVVVRYLLSGGGAGARESWILQGVLQNKSVLLKWEIATEKNLAKFVIERGRWNQGFWQINSVAAGRESNLYQGSYSIMDEQPLQGINFYRLKMVDADGKFTYSNIVAVKINADNKLQIFPNPAKRILFVEANGNNENAIVQIVDGSGRKLKEMKVFLNGETSFSVDISNLPKGIYNLILHKNEKTEVQDLLRNDQD